MPHKRHHVISLVATWNFGNLSEQRVQKSYNLANIGQNCIILKV